jgi:glycogen debranching enzyme
VEPEACRVLTAIVEAAEHFEHHRLPEVFAGFRRDTHGVPVRYPVACHPQAWAAGAVLYLMETVLGFTPEAFDHRLRIRHPVSPDFVHRFEIHVIPITVAINKTQWVWSNTCSGYIFANPRIPITIR